MDLGRRVRDLRNAQHLSQIELAAQAGVARNTLNRIENGHLMPTAPVIERLAEALDVVPGALFEEPVPLDEALDTGSSVDSTEEVITFNDEAVRAAITAAKSGKLTMKEAARAIADSVRGGPADALEDAVELLLEHAEASREEVEA
jgi:transcriptional regulator with XRE-family HTH domain